MSYKFNPFTGTFDDVGPNNGNGVPGGSDTQVQFNDNGVFGASADLTWDDTGKELGVGGDINLDDGGTYTTTLQIVTPTADRTISFPDATGTVALVAGSNGQLTYNSSGAQAGLTSASIGSTDEINISLAGAASTPPVSFTGSWFTGGTSTTTKPQLLIEPTGTTSTAWSTSGTGLGVNAASGFSGRLLDLQTNGTSRMVVQGDGKLGIGTTSPQGLLTISSSGAEGCEITPRSGYIEYLNYNRSTLSYIEVRNFATAHVWTGPAGERARIDSSGRLLVGTSSARTLFPDYTPQLQNEGTSSSTSSASLIQNSNNAAGPTLFFGKSRGTAVGSNTVVANNDLLGQIVFNGADGTDIQTIGAIVSANVDGTPGGDDLPTRLVFSTTADGASTPTERMRIGNDGDVLIDATTVFSQSTSSGSGIRFARDGISFLMRSAGPCLFLNRNANDGIIVDIRQAGNQEGTISVSGTTVSYNGAHLSRWSQLPGGATREEILRGTVLSNIDEMCDWGEEENEQLNRMKVSDVEGDKNVSGVFQAWDDDDDTYTDDFYCAMTGDFVIRIAQGVTVERGDLLMSAGDGTAKPQDDDIIRSKTVAKVTSTHVSETYADGSYCVPCVLMVC